MNTNVHEYNNEVGTAKRQLYRLADLAATDGIRTGPFGSQLKAKEYTEQGTPVVMPKDINGGVINEAHIARISDNKASQLAKHKIQPSDLIFPRRGDLRRIAVAMNANAGWICGTGCLRVRLKKNIHPNYLHQYVQLNKVGNWLERNALGQTMLNLNSEIIAELPILLPPLSEQRAIADLLSTWDDAIEKTERLIEKKEERFRGDLTKLSPSNKTYVNRDHSLTKTLKELTATGLIIEKGKPLTREDAPEGLVPVVAGGQTYSHYTNTPTHNFPTITVSASGAYSGFIWFHNYPIWASDCSVLFFNNCGSIHYLYYALKAQQNKVYRLQSGGAQPHVYPRDLARLEIPYPDKIAQKTIVNSLAMAEHEIDLLKQLLSKYQTQKRGLMQKLLTGEWRISPKLSNSQKEK